MFLKKQARKLQATLEGCNPKLWPTHPLAHSWAEVGMNGMDPNWFGMNPNILSFYPNLIPTERCSTILPQRQQLFSLQYF